LDKEPKPFNDVIEHLEKIEGFPTSPAKVKLKSLPKPIRVFGYIVIAFLSISFLLIILLNILN